MRVKVNAAGILLLTIAAWRVALGQTPVAKPTTLDANAAQIAHLLNLDIKLKQLADLRAQPQLDAAPEMGELLLRLQILETVQVRPWQNRDMRAESRS